MKNQPTNIRLEAKTLEKIQLASAISGKKSADIMRHAMELGLRRLEAVNYDLDAMLYSGVEAAEKSPPAPMIVGMESPKKSNDSKKAN